MSKKGLFWQNITSVGKNILAHVNINYDGARGSLHIDIIPADSWRRVDGETVIYTSKTNALAEHADEADLVAQDDGTNTDGNGNLDVKKSK